MNSQPIKTGIIYLIINIENYVNNILPYLYVGSKQDETKFDAYWSSSVYVKEDVARLGKQNFIKIVLKKVAYSDPSELLDVEQQYHNDLNVVEDPIYYNRAYANGKLVGSVTCIDKVWVNNGSIEKRVNTSLVDAYVSNGYSVGRQENFNKGRMYINKNGTTKSVNKSELGFLLKEGWALGRTTGNQTGKVWMHNTISRKLVPDAEVQDYKLNGWTIGCFRETEKNNLGKNRKPRNQSKEANANFGKYWITNGHENKLILAETEIPAGWSKGRILSKKP